MKCKMSDCFNCPYPDCINDDIEPTRQLSDEQKQHRKQYRKAIYHQRKEAGICVVCGKRPPEQGRVSCSRCLQKDRKKHEKSREKGGHTPRCLLDGVDLCSRCGKDKPVEGYKLCERCLKSLAHARQVLHEKRIHNGRQ